MLRLILFFLIIISTTNIFADDFESGMSFYNEERMVQALQLLKPIADKGNDEAQYTVGEIYLFNGFGVNRDLEQALNYLSKSAALGNLKAQYKLGFMYENGISDYTKDKNANTWFTPHDPKLDNISESEILKVAESGNKEAQYLVYKLFISYGKYRNPDEALRWLNKSAQQGYWLAKIKSQESLNSYSRDMVRNQTEDEKAAAKTYLKYTTPSGEANFDNAPAKTYNNSTPQNHGWGGGYDPNEHKGGYEGGYLPSPASTARTKNDFNSAKKQCADLGFKVGTEKFGKCILELSK